MFKKYFIYIYKSSKWKLLLLALFFDFIIFILNLMVDISYNTIQESDKLVDKSFIVIFLGPVILAPIIETLFFQTLLFRIGKYILLNDRLFTIISSLLFALSHRLNSTDIIFFFFRGFILCQYYLILKNRQEKAFFPTCLYHAIYNFIVTSPILIITFYERIYGKLE